MEARCKARPYIERLFLFDAAPGVPNLYQALGLSGQDASVRRQPNTVMPNRRRADWQMRCTKVFGSR